MKRRGNRGPIFKWLLLGVVALTASAAQAEAEPLRMPGRLLTDTNREPLLLTSASVRISIEGRIAQTTVNHEFINNTDAPAGSVFVCEVPEGATLCRFATDALGVMSVAEVLLRADAPDLAVSLPAGGPADEPGGRIFRATIGPIEPGAVRRIEVGFVQLVSKLGGEYRHSLPFVTQERVPRFTLDVEVRSPRGVQELRCASHGCRIVAEKGFARAEFSANQFVNQEPLELQWRTAQPAEPIELAYYRVDDGNGYFIAALTPPAADADNADDRPAKVLFMLDAAALAGGANAPGPAVLVGCLAKMGERNRFNVILCDLRPRLLLPDFVDNLPEFRKLARRHLAEATARNMNLFTGFDLVRSTLAAEPGTGETHVIYIGDGGPNAGPKGEDQIQRADRNLGRVPAVISAVAVGGKPAIASMREFAERNGGVFHNLAETTLDDCCTTIANLPIPRKSMGLRLYLEGRRTTSHYPQFLPPLFPGQEAVVVGKYSFRHGNERKAGIVFSGTTRGQGWRVRVPFTPPPEAGNAAIGQLWAARHIQSALEHSERDRNAELWKEAARTSIEHGVLSPFTFCAVISRGRIRPRDDRFPVDAWADLPPAADRDYLPPPMPDLPVMQPGNAPREPEKPERCDAGALAWHKDFPPVSIPLAVPPEQDPFLEPPLSVTFSDLLRAGKDDIRWLGSKENPRRIESIGRSHASGAIFPGSGYRGIRRAPAPIEIPDDVKAVIECFAHGLQDFHSRYVVKNGYGYDTVHTCTFTDGRFIASSVWPGNRTLTILDGEAEYQCHPERRYAYSRPSETGYWRRERALPAYAGLTPEEFVRSVGDVQIERRDGDVVVLFSQKYDGIAFYVDTARRVLLKEERMTLLRDGTREPARTKSFREFRDFGRVLLPMEIVNDDRQMATCTWQEIKLGKIQAEFAPPADWLVVNIPLPAHDAARLAAEQQQTASAWLTLALSLDSEGRLAEAAAVVPELERLHPNNPYVTLYGAWLESVTKDQNDLFWRKAQDVLAKAEAAAGDDQQARDDLAELFETTASVLMQLHLKQEQAYCTRRLIDFATGERRVSAAYRMAMLWSSENRHYEARSILVRMTDEHPNSQAAWSYLASYLRGRCEYQAAERAALKERELGSVSNELLQVYQAAGEKEKYVAELRGDLDKACGHASYFLDALADLHGFEAAVEEGERLLTQARTTYQWQQAGCGYLRFLASKKANDRLSDLAGRMLREGPDDLNFLSNVANSCTSAPMPRCVAEAIIAIDCRRLDNFSASSYLYLLQCVAQSGTDSLEKLIEHFTPPEHLKGDELARVLLKVGELQREFDPAKGEATLRRILTLDGVTQSSYAAGAAYRELYRIAMKKGDTAEAASFFAGMVRYAGPQAAQRDGTQLMAALWEKKEYDSLAALFTDLAGRDSRLEMFHRLNTAEVLHAAGKLDDAIETLRKIMNDAEGMIGDPLQEQNHPTYYFNKAGLMLARFAVEDPAHLRETSALIDERAAAEQPGSERRWTALQVHLLREQGRLDELDERLQALAREEPTASCWLRNLAALRAAAGDHAAALEIYGQANADEPPDARLLLEMSRLHAVLRDKDAALASWKAFLNALPDDPDMLNALEKKIDGPRFLFMAAVYDRQIELDQNPEQKLRRLVNCYRNEDDKFAVAVAHLKAVRPRNGVFYKPQFNILPGALSYLAGPDDAKRFLAALEREIGTAAGVRHRAWLTALAAQTAARVPDDQQAEQWMSEAIAAMAQLDESECLAIFESLGKDVKSDVVLRAMERTLAGAESPPDWLIACSAAQMTASGNEQAGRQLLQKTLESTDEPGRARLQMVFARAISVRDADRAIEACDAVIQTAPDDVAGEAAWRKGQLLVAGERPADEIIEAFRTAATRGSQGTALEAAKALTDFGKKQKNAAAVVEGCRLHAQTNKDSAAESLSDMLNFLGHNNLPVNEKRVREMIAACPPYNAGRAWAALARYHENQLNDKNKADAIRLEAAEAVWESSADYAYTSLLSPVGNKAKGEKEVEIVNAQNAAKYLRLVADHFLARDELASGGWPRKYWTVAGKIGLADEIVAKLAAAPRDDVSHSRLYALTANALHEHLGEHARAIDYYRMACELRPRHERQRLLNGWIDALKQCEQWQAALERSDEVMTLVAPGYYGYVEAVLSRTSILLALDRRDDARAQLEEGALGGDSQTRCEVGKASYEAGFHDLAIEQFRLSLELLKRSGNRDRTLIVEPHRYLALALAASGRREEAIDQLAKAMLEMRSSDRDKLYPTIEKLVEDTGDIEEYVAEHEKKVKQTGVDMATIRGAIAGVFYKRGEFDKALEHYRKATLPGPVNTYVKERIQELQER